MAKQDHQAAEQQPAPEETGEIQTLGFWATFIYYFTGTTVISAIAMAQALHLGLSDGVPYRYGILLGLLAGLIGAYYNRTTSLQISFSDPKAFTQQLNQTLADLGFTPHNQLDNYQIYRRPGFSHFFSGSVMVQITPGTATLLSRAANMRKLRQKLQ